MILQDPSNGFSPFDGLVAGAGFGEPASSESDISFLAGDAILA